MTFLLIFYIVYFNTVFINPDKSIISHLNVEIFLFSSKLSTRNFKGAFPIVNLRDHGHSNPSNSYDFCTKRI